MPHKSFESFVSLPEKTKQVILTRARAKKICFPESGDARILEASKILKNAFHIEPILISDECCREYRSITENSILLQCKTKEKQPPKNIEDYTKDPFFVAGALVQAGIAQCGVGGATVPTAHVLRAILSTLGTNPEHGVITSCILFALQQPTEGGENPILYTDPGVIPVPSSQQLSTMGALASQAFLNWTNQPAKVGFLSFSTAGSAQHPEIEKVRTAANLFHIACPQVLSEGELQFDAATVPEIALRKNPKSRLQGKTNVFVFPNLDAANISYKITQRLGNAQAWGPILLGCNQPFSDLSRGASVEDIVHISLLTAALC